MSGKSTAMDAAMSAWAEDLQAAINGPWPENTGRSRWTVEKTAPAAYSVGSPARYAPHVHLKGEREPFITKHAPAIVARVGAKHETKMAAVMLPYINIREIING